ncbi:hypothetical protein CRG98_007740 [Punica granatum]|uniref:Uncharacterized protein n=1 Tax=Punica granatum TaxID=22663 RepID=A0A2I0KTT5_PUNGR|nr:hypothetical protein CRG98_007740 [Punica granatum]
MIEEELRSVEKAPPAKDSSWKRSPNASRASDDLTQGGTTGGGFPSPNLDFPFFFVFQTEIEGGVSPTGLPLLGEAATSPEGFGGRGEFLVPISASLSLISNRGSSFWRPHMRGEIDRGSPLS